MKPLNEEHLAIYRRHMVEVVDVHFDLLGEEIGKPQMGERLRSVLSNVPRHLFVPPELAAVAYHDGPLPIGFLRNSSSPISSASSFNTRRCPSMSIPPECASWWWMTT